MATNSTNSSGGHLEFTYCYKIQNESYTGSRYCFGGRLWALSGSERVARNNPVGQEISVYVNPDKPSASVIDRDLLKPVLLGLLPLSIALLGFVVIVGVNDYAKRHRIPKLKKIQFRTGSGGIEKLLMTMFFTFAWICILVVMCWKLGFFYPVAAICYAPRNVIRWHLVIKGEIIKGPDISDEYEVYLAPKVHG